MERKEITTVVWDGDNTLWDWMRYAVPAYEAMCAAIAELAGKSFDETADAMKAFYTEKGTLEDEGLIQGLLAAGFFDSVTGFDEPSAIKVVQRTFSKVRHENLQLYHEIAATIEAIHNQGLRQLLLTDAPRNQARARLRRFDLLPKIEDTYGMPIATVPRLPKPRKAEPQEADLDRFILKEEKPHTDLERILDMTRGEIAEQVVLIGDNLAKEMKLAEKYGCLGVHAAYGVASDELRQRLQKFAPAQVAKRNMQVDASPTVSANSRIVTANHPGEIWGLIQAHL